MKTKGRPERRDDDQVVVCRRTTIKRNGTLDGAASGIVSSFSRLHNLSRRSSYALA